MDRYFVVSSEQSDAYRNLAWRCSMECAMESICKLFGILPQLFTYSVNMRSLLMWTGPSMLKTSQKLYSTPPLSRISGLLDVMELTIPAGDWPCLVFWSPASGPGSSLVSRTPQLSSLQ